MRVLTMYSTHEPSPRHLARLAELGADVTVADSEATALRLAPDTDVILGHRYLRQVLPRASRLRWVQSTAGGVDRLPVAALRARGVTLTRMVAAAPVIAQHAVTLAWALTRSLPDLVRQYDRGEWSAPQAWLPLPRRALVLGMGPIGQAIAEQLRTDGTEVLGLRRSSGPVPAGFDRALSPAAWRRELPTVDWLFLALPSTPETKGMVGAAELGALPPHALIVNVGRGETLDTEALCEALRGGHLGGAALDVASPEPPPPQDPVWTAPRLLLTPHVAAHYAERARQIEAACEAQFERYLGGVPLHELVT